MKLTLNGREVWLKRCPICNWRNIKYDPEDRSCTGCQLHNEAAFRRGYRQYVEDKGSTDDIKA